MKVTTTGKTLTEKGYKAVLRECIVQLASLDSGVRLKDIAELVESYILHNDHERGTKFLKYKIRPGYPGPGWLASLIKKNNLSLK